MKKNIGIICLGLYCASLYSFSSFNVAEQYANAHDEYPMPDNVLLENPSYLKMYQKLTNTWWWSSFSAREIKRLLREVKVEQKSIIDDAKHVFVWSDLCGSFHSLIRALRFLIKQNTLSDDLILTNKDDYIIFSGDLLGPTPYNLELLAVMLMLIERNKGHVLHVVDNDATYHQLIENNLVKPYTMRIVSYFDIMQHDVHLLNAFFQQTSPMVIIPLKNKLKEDATIIFGTRLLKRVVKQISKLSYKKSIYG
jgi:hypothetical protein